MHSYAFGAGDERRTDFTPSIPSLALQSLGDGVTASAPTPALVQRYAGSDCRPMTLAKPKAWSVLRPEASSLRPVLRSHQGEGWIPRFPPTIIRQSHQNHATQANGAITTCTAPLGTLSLDRIRSCDIKLHDKTLKETIKPVLAKSSRLIPVLAKENGL